MSHEAGSPEGSDAPAAPAVEAPTRRSLSALMDRYGSAVIVAMLGVTAIEMLALAPMIRFGVDLGPLLHGWHGLTGLGEPTMRPVAPTWPAAIVASYVLTRPLKVLTVPMSVAMTPQVRRWMDRIAAWRAR